MPENKFIEIKESLTLAEKFFCIRINNQSGQERLFNKDLDATYIQFHFCLRGEVEFVFNNGNYRLKISENRYLILYNPKQALPLNINLKANSILITALISIERFHNLFSQDGHKIDFLSGENSTQKYYKEDDISNTMLFALNQMLLYRTSSITKDLYLKSKIYEIFSLIFDNKNLDIDQCPFIMNDDQLKKIRHAKDIIINRYMDPPTLIDLSKEINLSLRKLKQGFKETYGRTVFKYLFEYKMELALKLLKDGENNVNEVSFKLGYSNASHFIYAFKSRFGITPRAYMIER